MKNSTGAQLEASLAGVGNEQECAVLGAWLCPWGQPFRCFVSKSLLSGGRACFVAGMVYVIFRKVLGLTKGSGRDWGAPNWPFASQTSKQDGPVAKADFRKLESQMPALPTYSWRYIENREETPEAPLSFAELSSAPRGGRLCRKRGLDLMKWLC